LCDPHGACGFQALKESLKENQVGVFLETAHPAKFTETMEKLVGTGKIPLPDPLAHFMKGKKKSSELGKDFNVFKTFLINEG
jgi:threonine synthase